MLDFRDREQRIARALEADMTRNLLAIATALLAAPALFASAAEACISCEYVPEVARSPAPSYAARPYVRERVYAVERQRSHRAEKHIVKHEPIAKKVETAERAPIKTQAKSENSSIASAAETAPETAKVDVKAAQSENSSISPASVKAAASEKAAVVATTQEASAKPVDCRKFFPSVGMTVSVPCE
jgi:hypothetical protein